MTTALLLIFNFIVIIGLISLISTKFSKYILNKDTIDHIKKILIRFNLVIISFNLFSYIAISEGLSTTQVILIGITCVVDGIYVICLASCSKSQKNLNN